jgi:uncharacterized protein (TIRG00374 family)
LAGASRWVFLSMAIPLGLVLVCKSSLLGASLLSFEHLQATWFIVAAAFEAASMASFVRMRKLVLQAEGVPLTIRSLIAITYAGNAISLSVPIAGSGFGTAFTYRQLSARGAPRSVAAWALSVTGILSTLSFVMIVAAGAIISGNHAAQVAGIIGAGVTVVPIVVVLVALRHRRSRDWLVAVVTGTLEGISRQMRRPNRAWRREVVRTFAQFNSRRLTARAQAVTALLALANWTFDIACLACAIKAVGLAVPWTALVLAWSAGVGVGSFNLTPGGLGVVEAALATALVAAHLPATHAMASVLVYRVISFWLVTSIGWGSYLLIRRLAFDRSVPPTPRPSRPPPPTRHLRCALLSGRRGLSSLPGQEE